MIDTNANNTKLIGLTGGIGSGKSTAAKLFQEHHVQYIDVDDLAREVVQPGEACLQQIVDHFGPHVLLDNGELNRAALREMVFSKPEQRKTLEAITHPAIRQRLAERLSEMTGLYALLVHPLLFETGQNSLCDYTIAIKVPRELQIERVMQRDRNSRSQVEHILDAQLSNAERCSKADFILENTGNSADLSVKVLHIHNKLQTLLS
ncbi:Dephospho-CoA kinase [Marinomonas aquimarina]|uniref:Dephospho-CoA kinase n=1 Tax=Marinomonas aquimarina TaxID=295068 RepID=A0A1A8TG69_9GAMM|nr:dephospho-CoA kinase [Marinomonas aquimarina]SBS31236.1 Dephospho-CoA kinase [Marinomonas aquimarina]